MPNPLVVVLDQEAFRAELLTAAASRESVDQRGALVVLRNGWPPIPPATLMRWAKTGRLRAFEAERGKVVAWEADIRTAVEANPVAPTRALGNAQATCDEAARALIADPELEDI